MPVKDLASPTRGRRRLGTPLLCCIAFLLLVFGSIRSTILIFPLGLFSSAYHYSPTIFSPHFNTSTVHCLKANNTCPSSEVWHSLDDEELFCCVSMTPPRSLEETDEKVAFMFLTRGRMPLRPLWERFFGSGHENHFSIYIHTSPEYMGEPPEGSVFSHRRIPSKGVEWGRASMIDAERRLLANALLGSSNEWFILLSESCIPLFNFSTIYDYLTNSELSFVGSFDDPRTMGRGRYNKRMSPIITLQEWRKGSQWFAINRKLATAVVSDSKYYHLFKEHCRPPCYMDEHYLPTFVTKLFPEINSNRSLTFVDWSRGGSHPKAFRHNDVSPGMLQRMRHGGSNCPYNGRTRIAICSLFARKFDSSTLGPLMRIAPKMFGFDP